MKKLAVIMLVLFSSSALADSCPSLLKFVKRKLNSQETVNFCESYANKTLLIVNTASYCGFTPQFEGLENLYAKYKDQGFYVLGFPSHDFKQEDGDEGKTAELCELTYGVKFPMFEPIAVRGDDVDPLYRMLAEKSGTTPKWNFYKYLVNAKGEVVDSFSSMTKPEDEDFIKTIEATIHSTQ
ncbi:glutathione peroxidase [Alteromonadaceae bacterium BrNp21-10]|nr:glutathione peroxidase [Alteromonadaceae bacterium BrNp21-10]